MGCLIHDGFFRCLMVFLYLLLLMALFTGEYIHG
jgi:hypothetical protein